MNISCTSTGIPIPTITWTVDDRIVPYPQADLTFDYSVAPIGEEAFEIKPGVIVSYLLIANLMHLDDDDVVYTCMGSNTHGEDSANTSTSLWLRVLSMFTP